MIVSICHSCGCSHDCVDVLVGDRFVSLCEACTRQRYPSDACKYYGHKDKEIGTYAGTKLGRADWVYLHLYRCTECGRRTGAYRRG